MNNIKEKLTGGHKNDTYKTKLNGKYIFLKEKHFDPFNHKIKYNALNAFDFIPKLIEESETENKWEWIDGEIPKMDEANLKKIAEILKTLHNSKKIFPKSNHRKRLVAYFGELNEYKKGPKEIYDYYERAYRISKRIKGNVPIHNDPWMNNFIKSKDNKMYLIDWEYASMGDKHFDLAFFIDGSWLNSEQEEIFLKAYGDYNPKILGEMKFFVNYLTIVWMHRLDKLPFPYEAIIKNLKK